MLSVNNFTLYLIQDFSTKQTCYRKQRPPFLNPFSMLSTNKRPKGYKKKSFLNSFHKIEVKRSIFKSMYAESHKHEINKSMFQDSHNIKVEYRKYVQDSHSNKVESQKLCSRKFLPSSIHKLGASFFLDSASLVCFRLNQVAWKNYLETYISLSFKFLLPNRRKPGVKLFYVSYGLRRLIERNTDMLKVPNFASI
ncbi:hypothetical protein M9H77_29883 [Catharanthus roseus]|uniref:Uncharacterized protein n=1 Tax=Catharanthus roseus TaxID=4058 RepID=A0ACB9ZZJ6_CATRO|nr:hypothetical protein M9H77_29883 [Catharanthus roseus]